MMRALFGCLICRQFASHPVLELLATADSGVIPFEHEPQSKLQRKNLTLHVLWDESNRPRPDPKAYSSWYSSRDVQWVTLDTLPNLPADAQVEIFFCSKPVFSVVGRLMNIWHGAVGFRIVGGATFMFEYTSLDFMAAVAYPDMKQHVNGSSGLIHWPSTAIVDYTTDATGQSFPVTGPDWHLIERVGKTTGEGFNKFAEWAFKYGESHARYLVWRVLENTTEATLIESEQCFEFVFRGFAYLKAMGLATFNVTQLPRTVVNVYAQSVDRTRQKQFHENTTIRRDTKHQYHAERTLDVRQGSGIAFDDTVNEFFQCEHCVLAEWAKLTGEIPVPFEGHPKTWYWPAWFGRTPTGGGSGDLLQDVDYPSLYHKYELTWPSHSRSPATRLGVQRVNMDIFPEQQVMV